MNYFNIPSKISPACCRLDSTVTYSTGGISGEIVCNRQTRQLAHSLDTEGKAVLKTILTGEKINLEYHSLTHSLIQSAVGCCVLSAQSGKSRSMPEAYSMWDGILYHHDAVLYLIIALIAF